MISLEQAKEDLGKVTKLMYQDRQSIDFYAPMVRVAQEIVNKLELEKQLEDAKENVRRLQEEYADEPDLLAFYLPSAEWLVAILESDDDE